MEKGELPWINWTKQGNQSLSPFRPFLLGLTRLRSAQGLPPTSKWMGPKASSLSSVTLVTDPRLVPLRKSKLPHTSQADPQHERGLIFRQKVTLHEFFFVRQEHQTLERQKEVLKGIRHYVCYACLFQQVEGNIRVITRLVHKYGWQQLAIFIHSLPRKYASAGKWTSALLHVACGMQMFCSSWTWKSLFCESLFQLRQ